MVVSRERVELYGLLSLEKSKKCWFVASRNREERTELGSRIEVGVKRCKKRAKKGTSWVVIMSLKVVKRRKEDKESS